MSTTETALTARLVMPLGNFPDGSRNAISNELRNQFWIEHVTLQVEQGDPAYPCDLADGPVS
jgi:cobalt-zinc-cadmium efflux system protein